MSDRSAARTRRNIYGLVNLFSGGALLQLSIFALGIMPYITASIILQLLTVVIPRLEALKKEGQAGQTKITQYTRYLTVGAGGPAVDRASSRWPARGQLFPSCQRRRSSSTRTASSRIVIMVITMTAGTARHHVARRADHRPRHRQRHVAS